VGEGGGIGRKLRKRKSPQRKSKTGGTKEKNRREGRENEFYVFLEKTLLFFATETVLSLIFFFCIGAAATASRP